MKKCQVPLKKIKLERWNYNLQLYNLKAFTCSLQARVNRAIKNSKSSSQFSCAYESVLQCIKQETSRYMCACFFRTNAIT